MELLQGMVVADRFRLEREIGKGGMGAVWLARHLGLDIPCAVKFILAEAAVSPDVLERFEREAKAAAHIKSPHVVQILDYGVWRGMPYIAMELLDGEDLGARLSRCGRLGARETATLIGHVAHALGKAHAMGVVHRDVKPSNIVLVRDDDREVAKVVDFGIAKSHSRTIGEGHTRAGAVLGTPYYMSPEQARGTGDVDHRSDLWALGVVAFQCLTGRLPFESEGLGELTMKIMVGPLPVPSRLAPVPPGFDAWWARAAERDPARRFQSARELAEALYLALGISASGAAELREGASIDPRSSGGARIALGSSPPTPISTSLRPGHPPRGGPLLRIAAALGATLVVGAAVLTTVLWRAPRHTGAPSPAAVTAPPVTTAEDGRAGGLNEPPGSPPLVTAEPPDASVEPRASATATPTITPPGERRRAVPQTALTPGSARPAHPAPSKCDPPFDVDAAGHHHMKPQCL